MTVDCWRRPSREGMSQGTGGKDREDDSLGGLESEGPRSTQNLQPGSGCPCVTKSAS